MRDRRTGFRDVIRVLNERPIRAWPEGVIHHGARVLILLGLAFVVYALFPVSPVRDFPALEKGMVADRDIIAQVGFPIRKSEAELARERAEAAASVAPIFEYDATAVDTMLVRVGAFLERLDSAAAAPGGDDAARARIREVLASYGLSATDAMVDAVRDPEQRANLAVGLERAIREELPEGIVATGDLDASVASQLRIPIRGVERLVWRDSVPLQSHFIRKAASYLPRGSAAEIEELQRLALVRFFQPSIRLDREATEAARERARQAVPEIKGEVLAGERIVRAHEQVRDVELERLRAYQEHLAALGQLGPGAAGAGRAAGAFIYNLLILSVFGILLLFFRPNVYHTFRQIQALALLTLALVVAAAMIARFGAPPELIPIAFPALVIATLWDGRAALNYSLVMAVLLSGQTPFLGASILFTLVIGGAAASLCVRVIRRRAQNWVFISIIALSYVAAAIAIGLMRSRELGEIFSSMGWGVASATVSGILAMSFIPLFEALTRITTDQTLLELADLNRPLLKRLSLEAPGTYAHSINVANLAEAAARAIGANALLTRVGVYYHDVGKLAKPQYFIENQPPGRNPHDKLKPAMSATIVRGHVLEGLRLADEAKLPESVKRFIAEHHGTQPISFFYERARELDPDGEVDEQHFCYPGPKPQSKETAIVMLADSVESAARVLQDPTPQRIRELVDRIVEGKIARGQLDESPLTMRELTIIKEQFASVLSGMYHHRIDYPTTPREQPEAAVSVAPGGGAGVRD